MRQVGCDVAEPPLEMILAIRYPSREAIATALASEVRQRARDVTNGLLAMFDGNLFHTVFDAADFPMALARSS